MKISHSKDMKKKLGKKSSKSKRQRAAARRRKAREAFWRDNTIKLPNVNLRQLPNNISSFDQLKDYIQYLSAKPAEIPSFLHRITPCISNPEVFELVKITLAELFNKYSIAKEKTIKRPKNKELGGGFTGEDVSKRQGDGESYLRTQNESIIPKNKVVSEFKFEYGITDT